MRDERLELLVECSCRRIATLRHLIDDSLTEGVYALAEYPVHFHAQVDEWKDRGEIVQQEREVWQFARNEREGRKHRIRCKELVQVHEMRKEEQGGKMAGTCHGFKLMGKEFNNTLKQWGNRHHGGHDPQRIVDTNGRFTCMVETLFW